MILAGGDRWFLLSLCLSSVHHGSFGIGNFGADGSGFGVGVGFGDGGFSTGGCGFCAGVGGIDSGRWLHLGGSYSPFLLVYLSGYGNHRQRCDAHFTSCGHLHAVLIGLRGLDLEQLN